MTFYPFPYLNNVKTSSNMYKGKYNRDIAQTLYVYKGYDIMVHYIMLQCDMNLYDAQHQADILINSLKRLKM